MNFFATKYRVSRDRMFPSHWAVQQRIWWWPFWVEHGNGLLNSREEAEETDPASNRCAIGLTRITMKALTVKALVEMETDIGSLAEVLARSPDDFAKFWFCFAELVKKDEIDLEPFGEAMAPAFGAMRKHPFNAITDYMRYYERKSETP